MRYCKNIINYFQDRMKKNVIYLVFFFLLLGFVSSRPEKDVAIHDLQYDLSRYIKDYYCIYLKYPTVNELCDFCWDIVNSANECRFRTYCEYQNEERLNINGTGAEYLLSFLKENHDNILFQKEGQILVILWQSKLLQTVHLNYCDLINESYNRWNFFSFFDSLGNYKRIDNDEEDFIAMRKKVKQKYQSVDNGQGEILKPYLIRYDRISKYAFLCPQDSEIASKPYLKDFEILLDSFLLKKKMQMIQFVSFIPPFDSEHKDF